MLTKSIIKILKKNITEKEKEKAKIINDVSYTMCKIYRSYVDNSKNEINYKIKEKGKNKGQYGYYHNESVGELNFILERLKIKSFCDLGSGAGLLLKLLKIFNKNINNIEGYEIESKLIDYSQKNLTYSVSKKDILKLTKEDVKNFEVLYFWEPLYNIELCKKFVENLEKIMYSGQIIIYKPSGNIRTFLEQSNLIQSVNENNYFFGYKIYRFK